MVADPREERIRSVLVVGGGTAGWMAATYLRTVLSRDIEVKLVESDAIGVVGVGEATIPPLRKINNIMRIDERAFMRDSFGTFKMGIEFVGWGAQDSRYLHQFGKPGRDMDAMVAMHHWWCAGQLAGRENYPGWGDLHVSTVAAKANRFMVPKRGPDLQWRYSYAFHFDALLYGQHMRKVAEERGAKRIEGTIEKVERDGENGHVDAVVLESGERIEADLFVDCSGFRSLLLGGTMEEPFDDWSHWLPADRALAVPTERGDGPLIPYTRATAHPVGWQWRIPLQHRTGNGHVFMSAFSTEDEAHRRLMDTIDTPATADPRLIKFQTGRRRRAWVGNVVGLGLATGFLEPLESTSIHLVQSGLERLAINFPTRQMDALVRDRYNRDVALEWEQVRDFIIAHYKVNQRTDSEFWRAMAAMDIPDSLAETLALWEGHGTVDILGNHLFQHGSWTSMLFGQNLMPRKAHAMTDRADADYIADYMVKLAAEVEQAASRLPPHEDFLAQYAPAEAVPA